MKRNKFFLIFIILLALVLISFYFDDSIVRGISHLRNYYLDEFFLGITFVSSEIILFFILTSMFLWQERKRKWILPLWLSMFFAVVISYLLKISAQRLRPFQQEIVETIPALMNSNYLSWNFSFPSFQAMLVFCAIPILSKEFPRMKYFWFLFAGLVAFSRVYFGVHFMSDVLVGAIIGYIIGAVMVGLETRKRTWSGIYEKRIYGEKS